MRKPAVFRTVLHNSIRIFLALALALAVRGIAPSAVEADTSPVNLELGGSGAVPWDFQNIKPSDSGTRTVELRNTGTVDGWVTVWVSNIVSGEGLNPPSETGDTAGFGELDQFLRFSLSGKGITSNVQFPVKVRDLPRKFDDKKYIDVIPVKAGSSVNLTWQWILPASVGNEIQGDILSFDINYMLREAKVTNLTAIVDSTGNFTQKTIIKSATEDGQLEIDAATTGLDTDSKPLDTIWIIELERDMPDLPAGKAYVGTHFDAGPDGTAFDKPIKLSIRYRQVDILPGVVESELVIAVWDNTTQSWVTVPGSVVDTVNNIITAPISHFSRYSVISSVSATPPASPPVDDIPGPIVPDDDDDIPTLEFDMLDSETSVDIDEDGTLSTSLTLSDASGNFILYIARGTRVTGPGGLSLSRIELSLSGQRLETDPDMHEVISPVYELAGYTADGEKVRVEFEPPAGLVIKYDLDTLPENSFLPFIAAYSEEDGLIYLEHPGDEPIELGMAKALVSGSQLYAVVVEIAPPPPPLPASFKASRLLISPEEVNFGDPLSIMVTIENEGETAGTYELHLIVDGIVRTIEQVHLNPLSSEVLTFEILNLSVGNHRIELAGLTGWVKVLRAEASVDDSGINWFAIDVTVGAVIVVCGLVLLYIIRRARKNQQTGGGDGTIRFD